MSERLSLFSNDFYFFQFIDLEILQLGTCYNLSDVGLVHISKECLKLKELEIPRLKRITSVSLLSLLDYLFELEVLNISSCFSLGKEPFTPQHETANDYSFIPLMKHFNQQLLPLILPLKKINLSNLKDLNDTSLILVTKSLPQIKVLDLSWCTSLTDTSIVSLAPCCIRLTEIYLDGCYELTDTSILALSRYCPFLQVISLDLFNQSFHNDEKIKEKEELYCNHIRSCSQPSR